MEQNIYWIFSQLALGAGSRKCVMANEYFGSMENFCAASAEKLFASGIFSRIDIEKIKAAELEDAVRVVQKCERAGIRILTPDDADYPERLRNIAAPPAALYILGTLPNIDDEVLVAVVGTRTATPYGRKAAQVLSVQLAKAGAVVVSGGALGVDSDALTGALAAGGKTVAVLGCAVNYPYLMQNQKMREHIAKTGALISEYPPGTPPSKTTFPCRNRLISGISLGTAVIEASGKSGSLITANFAVDQGRDVFVLPGRADSPNYAGSLRLLEDGAKPVYKARDILEEYARMYPHRLDMRDVDKLVTEPADDLPGFMLAEEKTTKTSPNPNKKSAQTIQTGERIKKNILEGVSQNALIVYNAFDNATLQCDEAARKSGLPIGQVLSAITELEIAGCLEALPGNRYKAL